MDIPEGLSKQEVEFWAWLTESYILPDPLDFGSSRKGSKGFRLVSTEEIKQLIADAFDKGDSLMAEKLLEIASELLPMSDEIIRKSIRLRTGEYLKLLYIKLLEETSFSDVIVKILMPYTKEYLESFKSKWKDKLTNSSDRVEHLLSLIESWDDMSPESRTRAVDMGLSLYEGINDIQPDYPYKLEEVNTALSDFIISELERKLLYDGGAIYRERSRVYDEFEKMWRSELEENPLAYISLNVYIDHSNANILLFNPKARLSRHLTDEEQLNLFDTYGERDVVGFIRLFNVYSGTEKVDYRGSLSDEEIRRIYFWIDVDLPMCSVTIENANNYNVSCLLQSGFIENIRLDSNKLMSLVTSLGKSIEIDTSSYFAKDDERFLRSMKENESEFDTFVPLIDYARSSTWIEFLKLATRLAKPSDFITIKNINSYRNRILNYGIVKTFITDLVDASVKRRSVVSFYVSKDVWRFLPLLLKEKDWYTMADLYLSSKNKETE